MIREVILPYLNRQIAAAKKKRVGLVYARYHSIGPR
jgi:hypothetical protein